MLYVAFGRGARGAAAACHDVCHRVPPLPRRKNTVKLP